MMWQFPQVGNLKRLEQAVFADLILLGGTKSDYYNVIDRDYNMGSGFSLKSKTQMVFPRLGYFSLLVDYYHIYTWKGYEGKDLEHTNPLYLNAQGPILSTSTRKATKATRSCWSSTLALYSN